MQPATPKLSVFQKVKKFSSSKKSQTAGTGSAAQPLARANIGTDTSKPDAVQTHDPSVLRPIAELWDEAYEDLRGKDETKNLIVDYEQELSKSLAGVVAPPIAFSGIVVERRQQMKVLLEQQIKEMEKGTWKLKFKSHEFAVKE